MKNNFIISLFLLLLTTTNIANAKNLYVNNSGSPACSDATTYANNNENSPWCGLLRAVRGNTDGNRNTTGVTTQAAQAGDVVLVTAGTYTYAGATWYGGSWLSVLYDPINSGTSGAWIEFRAVGTVHLTGNVGTDTSGTLGSNGSQYIKWNGFTMNEATSAWRNSMAIANANNITFENLTVIGQYRSLGGDNHSGIMTHYGSVTGGVCDGHVSNITISNNLVYGFTGDSSVNDTAIKLYCVGDNVTINNNELHSSNAGIQNKTQRGPETNVRIFKNYIHDNLEDGFNIQSPTNWSIYQNLIVDNEVCFHMMNTQYYLGFPTTLQPHDIKFVNNTCYNHTLASIYLEGFCGNMYDNIVQNNLLSGTNRASLNSEGVDCENQSYLGTDDIAFNYNYHTWSTHFFSSDGGGSVISYATWTATWGQDANSVQNGNPLFVNAAGGDFTLQGGSPAINAGIDILDLDGDSATDDAITLGAYITGNEIIGVIGGSTITTRVKVGSGNRRFLIGPSGVRITIQ